MSESEEERVIGIQGVISKIEIMERDYKNNSNAKVNRYYSLMIILKTGSRLIAYEDSSKQRIAEISNLNSIYESEKRTELSLENDTFIFEKLNQFKEFKSGDSVIIRVPYWSVAKYLAKETESVRIYQIERVN